MNFHLHGSNECIGMHGNYGDLWRRRLDVNGGHLWGVFYKYGYNSVV